MPIKTKPEDKKHIRCLYIHRDKRKNMTYDLGLLTDDFTYYDCTIKTKYKDITTDFWLKMRYTYHPFQFSKNTEICISNTISVYEPIGFYHKILQEQLYFNMKFIDINMVPRRIAAQHPSYLNKKSSKNINVRDINKLWEKILKYGKCPWITDEVEPALIQYNGIAYFKRKQFVRMAMYYMLVKKHIYNRVKKSIIKNISNNVSYK